MLKNKPIQPETLQSMLNLMIPATADDADLYLEQSSSESLALEEGRVKHVSASTHQGIGARVVCGETAGHAYTDRFETAALLEAAKAARAIAGQGQQRAPVAIHSQPSAHQLYLPENPASGLSMQDRKTLLESIDKLARSLDPRVKQVFASLSNSFDIVDIFTMSGQHLSDARPLVRLNVSVVVESGDKRETGSAGGGGRFTLSHIQQTDMVEHFTREAVRMALLNLDAIAAPAGPMPVVLGPGWPGILLHEAIGHGLEGDFNRKGTSVFSNKIGKQVAAAGVTVVDDGTIPNRRGSLNVDDEGTATSRTVLIENGILKGYMQDKQNARLMGMPATGNGRRESYADPVLPRMTNTFMLAGNDKPEDILASLDRGIYAVNFGGGQVDITSGKFVFTTSEAYLVEKGKIIAPVKGATLIGMGHEVLKKVSMVGNDLELDPGVGSCGKDGQSVPVGVGMPTIRVDELTVGGTEGGQS
ncbi:MAG: metalloprotease TldD [Zetaproteobacteria bacterium CG_4_9_14_3_um_filter_49_83]|nr:MAG: metalloprotease TldD [Zetaproteobacteria bacterium CG1_02_49_23]PIQ33357.1 MAG: metalloprotease TldD [Zetaproteobacteria bacterium CG17_big_fil_post_rev_8_21_14_2_50_50_13]PIY57089.1 MAG: metalloprotease TldD [Zetaproteobacteria bacterium CG_4_10_14_0_8_um_filter_49_80]PJA35055.1 MAG: metalloprotease TldD [Zetaproteobacteria bacterium CG_4_9_14_3_um_filter_49_83]